MRNLRAVVLAAMAATFCSCPLLCPPPGEGQLRLWLNGACREPAVGFLQTETGLLLDVSAFMEAVGGRFVPVVMNAGIATQYGKRIGFSLVDYEFGAVQTQLCPMEPRCRQQDGVLYAPVGYFEMLLEGTIEVKQPGGQLRVCAPPPAQPGSIIPQTAPLVRRLEAMGYIVQQGSISLIRPIEICRAGYVEDANGNNAQFPYFCIQAPQPPGADHSVLHAQIGFTLREDEALILVGRTPPECDYYSYRSYMLSLREPDEPSPFNRKKIFTQLGDPINNYNIGEWQPGRNRFGAPITIVSTADAAMYEAVRDAMRAEGLDEEDLLLDVIDTSLARLGNDDFADGLNFLHRTSNFHNPGDGHAYQQRPTLEILRVTPPEPRQAVLLEPFTPRQRGSGVTEAFLRPSVNALRDALLDAYGTDYDILELEAEPWLNMSGREPIDTRTDVLGETRDTLYQRTQEFIFEEDTVVVVYGVNHMTVPKAVYNNVSCYGAAYFNGFGGVTNYDYAGAARPYLPEDPYANKLYVWKFARTALDDHTFALPTDPQEELTGINNGDPVFMGYRAYVDPGCLIGPAPEEIIADRALVLTPKQRDGKRAR